MAYKELIKDFNGIRDYMREFYVYGFKSRDEYNKKSGRSYDDERRRLESWLRDYMQFRQTPDGKNVFISIDSRTSEHNPLYKAWKTKSFTDGDITLHFLIMDILSSPDISLPLNELTVRIDEALAGFQNPRTFDESTVRKKLKEYMTEGIIVAEKKGKTVYYRRADAVNLPETEVLDYFSEIAPCGVIGSYLLDQSGDHKDYFTFKHHYITSAMDSDVLCTIFAAMGEKRSVSMRVINRRKDIIVVHDAVPLKLMVSVQSGRQHLMAYVPKSKRMIPMRLDKIISVTPSEVSDRFDELRMRLDGMLPHIWGVSTQSKSRNRMERVEFTIHYGDNELHIPRRLEREKRVGTVERLDKNTSRFTADVYDSSELVPWIRTFICRITDIHFSNEALEQRFKDDIREMYAMYGLGDGENNDLQ